MDFQAAAAKYGTVTVDGTEYALTDQAEPTSRLLPLHPYHEASMGDTYSFEMSAGAIDAEGKKYMAYWIFEAVKGSERELDTYDYSDVDRIERID